MNYTIMGDNMPVAVINLKSGESIITEKGGMSWMTPNLTMETVGGGVGKMFGRMFSGESMFQNRYTANGDGMIAFASSFPGSIKAIEITPDRPVILQKKAFLAATAGVELSVHFQKKIGAGFFGGEGFIMQKLSGSGTAFVEIDGSAIEYNLAAGQKLVVETGLVAMIDASCNLSVETVKGVKNVLFGGEGLFNTVVTGPGRVVLQTMPMSKVAAEIGASLPKTNG